MSPPGDFPFSGVSVPQSLSYLLWGGMEGSLKKDMMPEGLQKKWAMSRQSAFGWEGQVGLHLTVQKLRQDFFFFFFLPWKLAVAVWIIPNSSISLPCFDTQELLNRPAPPMWELISEPAHWWNKCPIMQSFLEQNGLKIKIKWRCPQHWL